MNSHRRGADRGNVRRLLRTAKSLLKRTKSICDQILLSYPKRVECNICGWRGRHFLSDSWHKHINCPRCTSGIRHRLFVAALQEIDALSFERILRDKRVLHFAPEQIMSSVLRKKAAYYATADFLRDDFDLKLDISNMSEVGNESFDVVIAFDVLEHVPDYQESLQEVRRILRPKGYAIFTVPQKDNLAVTLEDPSTVPPEDRRKNFGQWDHLRVFGNDFPELVEGKGFTVKSIDESDFSPEISRRNVLFPPVLSEHPLATNHRKVFFAQKT